MLLHILLLILKIIGILLLVILGLIVLLLCTVLFVPFRYKASGSGSGSLASILGEIKFSWLLRFVSGHVKYHDKQITWQVRVAWFLLNKPPEENGTLPEETLLEGSLPKDPFSDTPPPEKPLVEATESKESMEIARADDIAESGKTSEFVKKAEPDETSEAAKIEESSGAGEKTDDGIFKKICTGIKAFLQKIKYTFQRFCDNIETLLKTKDRVEEFITDGIHQAAFGRGMKELKRLLKFLKPKRFYLNIHYGFDDPALTGKILGGFSILYPFVGKNTMNIRPDFEDEVYEGDFMLKGKIRMIYFVVIAWNLFWDKNIRTTYKHVKNFRK